MRLLVIDKITAENSRMAVKADRVIDFAGQGIACHKIIECSAEYNDVRDEIREKYIKYIAWLGGQKIDSRKIKEIFLLNKESSLWWFSEIVHKDTFNDAFLDDLCKTILVKRIKERLGADEIVLSCPEGSLMQFIFAEAKEHPLPFILMAMMSRVRLMVKYLRIKIQLWYKKVKDSAPNGTLFFSYYPNNWNKDGKGVFSDRVFRDLPSRIKDHGYIIYLDAVNVAFVEIGKAAYIQNNLSFWEIISRFLDIQNVVKYIFFRNKMRKLFFFEGIDINSIFDRYFWQTVVFNDYYYSVVAIGVSKIVSKLSPKQIVSAGEFGHLARATVVGAKTKGVPIIWLQHAVISSWKLWYFYASEEIVDSKGAINSDFINYMPVADLFLVWGEKSEEAMRKYGYPQERLKIVGNPRYDNFKKKKIELNCGWKNTIVFAPAIDCKEITTFASLAVKVKEKLSDREIILKMHPRYRDIAKSCEKEVEEAKQKGVQVNTENIEKYYDPSNILVCGVSTVGIEAAYFGVKVITFLSKYHDRFTPDWIEEWAVVFSAEELIRKIKNIESVRILQWQAYYQEPGNATDKAIGVLRGLHL